MIILGRDSSPSASFGFPQPEPSSPIREPIRYQGEAPITVIAPTGSGKGRDLLVPLLLTNPAPAIVIDIKGELSAVCRRRRLEMGNLVAVIDPFSCSQFESDRLNPLDLFALKGSQIDCDSEMIATQLSTGHEYRSDPFWTDSASGLLAGMIAYAASVQGIERSFASIRKVLFSDDTDYQIAVLLDTLGKKISPFAYSELTAYLQICQERTRPSVLASARTFMRSLNSASVAACMENATIDLQDIVDGGPIDIFITIPPEKILSHAGFLRVMVGTLLTAIMRRRRIPERPTLFVVDEAAQLGNEFAPLLTATTLMRGYGLQLVSAWQDMAQIKSRYKNDWQTILNNSGAILTFGMGHYSAAKEAADFLGADPSEVLRLGPDEALLAVRGEGTRKITRLNYLRDREFEGLADRNPYHAIKNGNGKAI